MGTIVVREIVCNGELTHEILGTTIALKGGAAVLTSLLTIAAIPLIQSHDREALLLVGILSVGSIFQAVDTIDLFFQSQVKSKITVWSKNSALGTGSDTRCFSKRERCLRKCEGLLTAESYRAMHRSNWRWVFPPGV